MSRGRSPGTPTSGTWTTPGHDRVSQSPCADARAHLDDALNLLEHCADIYARCDDTNRRLCNQALFTKIYVDEDATLRVDNARPFEMLLDPEVNADALTWAADADKARTSTLVPTGQNSSLVRWVPPAGFEPATHGLGNRCSIP